MNRRFKCLNFGPGRVSDLFRYFENNIFGEWDRVRQSLVLPESDLSSLGWGIKGHNYPWVLANACFEKGQKVLDIGGAYSLLPVIIQERYGCEVWVADDFGVESNEPLWSRWGRREKVQDQHPNIHYVYERLGNLKHSTLPQSYFDVIYSVSTLEHVPPGATKDVFDHMLHLLKPDGTLYHCIDVPLCKSFIDLQTPSEAADMQRASGWSRFIQGYFGDHLAGKEKCRVDEVALAMDPDVLVETPEIAFKFYPPNLKAKPYSRVATLTMTLQSQTIETFAPRIVTLTDYHPAGCRFEIGYPVEVFRIEEYGGEKEFTGDILSELKPTDVFYDVGSSVGFVAVHAGHRAAKVYAFEPDPAVRDRLSNNVHLNELQNVEVIPWAVSDQDGETVLYTDGANGNSPSLRSQKIRDEIRIETHSLDYAVEHLGWPMPDVVKMDIEGAELQALKGMHAILSSAHAPRAIFLELHPDFLPAFGATSQEVLDYLSAFGYRQILQRQRWEQAHAVFIKPGPGIEFGSFIQTQLGKAETQKAEDLPAASHKDETLQHFSELDLVSRLPFSPNVAHTLIDVGAHVGSFTAPFAKKGWHVFAFEPENANYQDLRANFKPFPNVQCFQQAVADEAKELPFYVSAEHWGIHSLKPFHPTHTPTGTVTTVRLDEKLSGLGVDTVTLLKIDIEGADLLALKGFDFNRIHPELVICEFMDERSVKNFGYSYHDMVRFMEQFGYRTFVSEWGPIKDYGRKDRAGEPHQFIRCQPYPLDHSPAWGNLLFVAPERVLAFEQTLYSYLTSLQPEKTREGQHAQPPITDSNSLNLCLQEAEKSFQRDDLPAACEALRQALELAPESPEIINAYGNLLLRLGNIEAARLEFIKSTVLAPEYAAGYSNLGAVQVGLSQYKEAEVSVQKALTLDPHDPAAVELVVLLNQCIDSP